MPQAVSSETPYIQRACPTCGEEELQRQPIEEEKELQAKPESGHISDVNPHLESQIQSLKGGGQPLSENDRAFFEPHFGRDFSQVWVHTDAKAAESAQAFIVGQDVVFGPGQFSSGSSTGKRLIGTRINTCGASR